jgi:hypothetical protein
MSAVAAITGPKNCVPATGDAVVIETVAEAEG